MYKSLQVFHLWSLDTVDNQFDYQLLMNLIEMTIYNQDEKSLITRSCSYIHTNNPD